MESATFLYGFGCAVVAGEGPWFGGGFGAGGEAGLVVGDVEGDAEVDADAEFDPGFGGWVDGLAAAVFADALVVGIGVTAMWWIVDLAADVAAAFALVAS
jgi:hypothetical protein